jgi:hypothetical protein
LDNAEKIIEKYANSAFVLYPSNALLAEVKIVATLREPVNIVNEYGIVERHFDMKGLLRTFGYTTGGYGRYADGNRLAPPIAVACVTPMQFNDRKRNVAVVNLIAMAFDTPLQPDRQLLAPFDELDKERLLHAMKQAYLFAFEAAHRMKRSTLYASPIGDGAFRPPGMSVQDFVITYVDPAIAFARTKYSDITVKRVEYPEFKVPSSVMKIPQKELDDALFINAWDCWSMLGNGNNKDNSADGWWGRSTAISLLGWPQSNVSMEYHTSPVPK